jgi:hypothetical protein
MLGVGQELVKVRHRDGQRELHVGIDLLTGPLGRDVGGDVLLGRGRRALLQKALHRLGEAQSDDIVLRRHNSSWAGLKSRPTDL